ncbi:MAG: thioesterase [Spirochaetia bacterium]|nr:thioesterase [Spirochaetia bacterium]
MNIEKNHKKVSRDYTILFYHVDQKNDLSIASLFNFYSEIALFHTIQAGFDFNYLDKNNLKWILYRMNIKVSRHPRLNDNIRVSTWGHNIIKFNAFRKFEMTDDNGAILSSGQSTWIMVDAQSMRPVRIPDEMFEGYAIERNNKDRFEIEALEAPLKPVFQKSFSVNYADLDYNQHATAARYADWALEAIPVEVRTKYDLSELCVNYFRELKYGEPVESVCSPDEENGVKIFHHGIFSQDEKPSTLLKSRWVMRSR